MDGNMQAFINWDIDSFCLGVCYVTLTYYVTTSIYFLINSMPHNQLFLGMCYVTTQVTPTMASLSVLGLFGFRKVTNTLYWDENATKHTHTLCATVTDMHRLSFIQWSCCAATWTCPCRGRPNTTEVPLLLEAHDVGDAGGETTERQCNLWEGRGSQPRSGESFDFHHGKTLVDDFSHQGAVGFKGGVIVTNCCRACSHQSTN